MAELYDFFHQALPLVRIKLANRMITSPHNRQLTPNNVYQIVLGVPRSDVLDIYKLATKHLTPDQLSMAKPWIELMVKEKEIQALDRDKRLGDLLAKVLEYPNQ